MSNVLDTKRGPHKSRQTRQIENGMGGRRPRRGASTYNDTCVVLGVRLCKRGHDGDDYDIFTLAYFPGIFILAARLMFVAFRSQSYKRKTTFIGRSNAISRPQTFPTTTTSMLSRKQVQKGARAFVHQFPLFYSLGFLPPSGNERSTLKFMLHGRIADRNNKNALN